MLEKGFKDDVEKIFEEIQAETSKKTQNLMFSATIPTWVTSIAKQYFASNMKRINLIGESSIKTSQTVQHFALEVHRDERHK